MINSLQLTDKDLEKKAPQQVARNPLQLKISIDVTMWLVFQGCSLRGHNENEDSNYWGNFIELIKMTSNVIANKFYPQYVTNKKSYTLKFN